MGVESSCDETAIAVIDGNNQVLSSEIATQTDLHKVFGGVVPEVAARKHLQMVGPLCQEALSKAGATAANLDAVIVTQGPGLIGSLLVGVSFAKGFSLATGLPLVPVDHVHAHVHGALLSLDTPEDQLFPALSLVVSGGHTNLYYMKDSVSYELIGYTIDDACGESFDKVAKLLGLSYPGGPIVEKRARDGDASAIPMPKMMEQKDRLEFSYSGLKTHVSYLLQKRQDPLAATDINNICAAFQEEALGQLVRKLVQACQVFPQCQSVIVAGGVAANQRFRQLTDQYLSIPTYFPKLTYCADNAAMIAAYGAALIRKDSALLSSHEVTWDAYSRYSFG